MMSAAQKGLGKDAAGDGEVALTVTLTPTEAAVLDEWIARHEAPRPSRAQAVRRLVCSGLTGHPGQ